MRLLAYAVFFAANLAIWDSVSGTLRIDSFTAMAATVLLSFAVILVHELGHAGAVWWLRRRVMAIAVGPVTAHFDPFRLGVTEDTDTREIGGFVIFSFDGWKTTRKDLIVAIAGPAANFVLAAAVACAAVLLTPVSQPAPSRPAVVAPPPVSKNAPFTVAPPSDEGLARALHDSQMREVWIPLFHALAILSAAAGIANLIPFSGSDGAEVRSVLRSRREARRYRTRSRE